MNARSVSPPANRPGPGPFARIWLPPCYPRLMPKAENLVTLQKIKHLDSEGPPPLDDNGCLVDILRHFAYGTKVSIEE